MSASRPSRDRPHVALFTSSLGGGGVQRSMTSLAGALSEAGYRVDLIVCHDNAGPTRSSLPADVRVIELARGLPGWGRLLALYADPRALRLLWRPILFPLKGSSKQRYLPALVRYLKRERPQALLSAMTQCNLVAVWAGRLAAVNTRIVVSERNMLSKFVNEFRHKWRWRHLPPLVRHVYRQADAVVAVSDAVAGDLAITTGLPRERIETVINPVVNCQLRELASGPVDHPWFADGAPPVVLGVCRLVAQKDPVTLLRAFAGLRRQRMVRLVILGEGPERARLEHLAKELGVADDVSLPGWVDIPYPYMARAGVLVLSSLWEGLPGVLIQAMACGCPVVATNCPGGSVEVLDHGRYGRLVAVGDHLALAEAIRFQLDTPADREMLRRRADEYSSERAAERYGGLLLGSGQHRDPRAISAANDQR